MACGAVLFAISPVVPHSWRGLRETVFDQDKRNINIMIYRFTYLFITFLS